MNKRVMLVVVIGALLSVLTAGVALAATFYGTPGPDELVGTRGSDELVGYAGNDRIIGRGGDDLLRGGKGADTISAGDCSSSRIFGGGGSDAIDARDGCSYAQEYPGPEADRDAIDCGAGFDTVRLSYEGSAAVSSNCERVVVPTAVPPAEEDEG